LSTRGHQVISADPVQKRTVEDVTFAVTPPVQMAAFCNDLMHVNVHSTQFPEDKIF
jgi:hypothetical protein